MRYIVFVFAYPKIAQDSSKLVQNQCWLLFATRLLIIKSEFVGRTCSPKTGPAADFPFISAVLPLPVK